MAEEEAGATTTDAPHCAEPLAESPPKPKLIFDPMCDNCVCVPKKSHQKPDERRSRRRAFQPLGSARSCASRSFALKLCHQMPHPTSLRTHNQAPQFASQICRRWGVSSGKSPTQTAKVGPALLSQGGPVLCGLGTQEARLRGGMAEAGAPPQPVHSDPALVGSLDLAHQSRVLSERADKHEAKRPKGSSLSLVFAVVWSE